ncbi:MAG: hypothetical protein ABJC12_04215 [Saprospiraceae bacterium]
MPLFSMGQLRNTPFNTSNNFVLYRFGIAYPFFSEGNQFTPYSTGNGSYDYLKKGFNYGAQLGIGFGHYFGKKFSIDISPFLIYSKFVHTDFHYEFHSNPYQFLEEERDGFLRFSHLSYLIPIDFNFKMKDNFEFTTGVFFIKPVLDYFFTHWAVTDYSYHPARMYSYDDSYKNFRTYSRTGFHVQISFLLKAKDWKEKRLNIEYYHSLTRANQVFEKWISIAFKKVFYQ